MFSQVYAGETQTIETYSNNVTVEVRVEDRNDNSPSFVEPFYAVTVKEGRTSGTVILQVFLYHKALQPNRIRRIKFM